MKHYMLCTDLDRTLISNGAQPESPMAKERFEQLVKREEITLVYVTGRHRDLVEQAIAEFNLPQPDYIISDVGSAINQRVSSDWWLWNEWDSQIAQDWSGLTHEDIYHVLSVFPALRLQEKEKQNQYKISFYVSLEIDSQQLLNDINVQLRFSGINANLIWSIDERAGIGLLDVLPASAHKLHAIRFLMQQKGFGLDNTIFAGDSGNDLDVLLSDISSVLVANADAEMKERVKKADPSTLYVAKGGYLGMNGNYGAGILEGVAHYWPEAGTWISEQA